MNLKNKNVLVTGGTGFIGSHLVEELILLGAKPITTFLEVSPYSYFASKKLENKTVMILANVNNFEQMKRIILTQNIDFVFHLAAQALVNIAYLFPQQTIVDNVLGSTNILECLRMFPRVKGVVIASSDKAYGKLTKKKYQESDPLHGDHPYEVSKSAADLISQAYYKTYNLPVAIARLGNVYGPGDINFSRILPMIFESILLDKKLKIRSNGRYKRDYLHVKDVVRGYLLMAERIDSIKGEAFNFGSENNYTVFELIKIVESTLGKKVRYEILNNAINEIPYQSLQFSKAKKVLGWRNEEKMSKSFKNILTWYNIFFKKYEG